MLIHPHLFTDIYLNVHHSNKRYDDGGGAIRTREEAGEVNIVECGLHRNAGTMGGAIFSRAFRTNIIGSHITDNTATVSKVDDSLHYLRDVHSYLCCFLSRWWVGRYTWVGMLTC